MYLDRHEANPYHSFMRIGMMIDAYKPYVSGVTNYIDLNKRVMEEAGHEVYVFTFGDVDYQDDEAHRVCASFANDVLACEIQPHAQQSDCRWVELNRHAQEIK